jgi:hypothetical protein
MHPTRRDLFAPPDHRWRRAASLAGAGLSPAPADDDPWVARAAAFLAALGRCPDEPARRAPADQTPAVSRAHALFTAEPPQLRWAVEARVLARESAAEIARKCGLPEEAVAAYEALFFDVRDRLDADTWVACQVVGPKAFAGLTGDDLGVWWKLVGYTYGPVALDALLLGTRAPSGPQPDALAGAVARDASARFALKRLLAAHVLPVTPETAADVLRLAGELGALRSAGTGAGRSGAVAAALAASLAGPALGPPGAGEPMPNDLVSCGAVDAAGSRKVRKAG